MKNEALTIHPIRYTFASNLRKIRRLKDISQESLALDAGVSRAYISEIERGKRSVSVDVVAKLAESLDVSIVSLLTISPALAELLEEKSSK